MSCASSFPVGPPMFSVSANTIGLNTSMRVVRSHDSVVPPHLLATSLSAAAQSCNHTAVPRVTDSSQHLLATP